MLTQVLYTVAELRVADEIGRKGPQTAQDLAMSLGERCPSVAGITLNLLLVFVSF